MASVRSTRSRPESYDTAVSVGGDHERRQAAPSLAASAADFLAQLLILWLHDGVSEQRAPLGIVAMKLDDRICGSPAACAEFLDVGCANDL
jgi:hypothetical protein